MEVGSFFGHAAEDFCLQPKFSQRVAEVKNIIVPVDDVFAGLWEVVPLPDHKLSLHKLLR